MSQAAGLEARSAEIRGRLEEGRRGRVERRAGERSLVRTSSLQAPTLPTAIPTDRPVTAGPHVLRRKVDNTHHTKLVQNFVKKNIFYVVVAFSQGLFKKF